MELLLRLLLSLLQHHLGVAIVAAVRGQRLAATSVQLNTRLPWQRQQQVLPWKILLFVHLSNFFPRRLLILVGEK